MTATTYFHEGEAALQAEAGVDTAAFEAMASRAMLPALNASEARFADERTFSVATTIDADGRPWSSPLFGTQAQQLFSVRGPTTVSITPSEAPGDPLLENISATSQLGVLYFDPEYRRRMKSIGRATMTDGVIDYRMHRNFGICNKYIFKRSHVADDVEVAARPESTSSSHLDETSVAQLRASDTAFLASFHEVNGADSTHRGGPAGFVTVHDESTVSLPDYMGNGMFNTLGNLRIDDRIGLMTVDFATGRTVQVTGRGIERPSPLDDELSERTLFIDIDAVVVSHAKSGTWADIEEFPIRPGMVNPATPYLP